MESPLALYRRYRPETFAEVIGQEHVTQPLRAALANNRVNHAYLFSGPRGCGKTTSARILARALNCEKAPIADPCGECDSCRDLARGGPGSIDVIEIDAASHGGVDDARDLREKAFFAPVKSRYKVYIIDEAHMVSTQGFNALLKLVEEPPEHLRFIFATTEPDKVIPTIRSRTHHYPFRLIPPRLLSSYLRDICEQEGVNVEPAALPLVVRAGGGSARDTLSVMDQLLGGAGPDGVTYDLAAGLLGYTPDNLLDEVVDAFAAGDGAAVFRVVDKVVETGQDPRRFTEDLLRRLRDLVIVHAVPDASATGLLDVSEDAGERLVAQAARFGAHDLSRAADIVATGLTEMRGATAPRLLLELICARVLLPGADHGTLGLAARLDRLERRIDISGTPSVTSTPVPAAPAQDRPVRPPSIGAPTDEPVVASAAPTAPVSAQTPSGGPASEPPAASSAQSPPQQRAAQPADTGGDPGVSRSPVAAAGSPQSQPAQPSAPPQSASPQQSATQQATSEPAPGGGLTMVDVRRLWPDVLQALNRRRKVSWALISQNAQPLGLTGRTLTLGFPSQGLRDQFTNGSHADPLHQAVIDVIGADWTFEAIVDGGAGPSRSEPSRPAPQVAQAAAPGDPAASPAAPEAAWPGAAGGAASEQAPGVDPWASPEASAPPRIEASPSAIAAAREAIQPTRNGGVEVAEPGFDPDAEASPDDLTLEVDAVGSDELLQRELGAQMIEEIPHQ